MASGIYSAFKGDLMEKQVDIGDGGDSIYVTLYDTNHAFTATDTVYTTTNELATAGGYTRGVDATNLLAGQAVTTGATTKWDATDKAWTSVTLTAYHAVIWDATNTNSLICSIDFGGAIAVSAGTLTLIFDAAGIITLT